eukprot:gene13517-9671_t
MKKIFHDLLALLRRRYALKFDRTESDGLSLASLSDFEVSLPLEILVAVVTLIMAIFDTRQSHFPTQENRKAHENDPLLSRAFREASEMLLGGAGTDFFMDHTKKRKSSGLPSSNAPSTSSAGTSLRKEGGSIDDFQISESIVALLTQTFLWKFAESSPSAEKVIEKMSYRTDMLTAFADHVEFMQRDFVQRVQQKENRLRGGRRIWDPSEPLAPGDLIDCMDKEKSWFESIVVDVAADGSIRVHFLGWAAKWDDTITEAERPIRLAPLNTHTRNWRGDLFEGGLIEVKCNDDVVNQKWMWGRITKLNVEESWVEIAYSFSSEPVVVKKAWLYGETICPVGMHTKDKSRAAASLITRPGKTVKEILAEKISTGRSDVAFYDFDDDLRHDDEATTRSEDPELWGGEMNHLSMMASVGTGLSFDGQANVTVLPHMAKFLFDSTFEEVYRIVAGVVGTFLQDHRLPSEEDLQQTLYPVARVVQSIAATKWRDSLARNYVQVLYVQAGTAAKSIAGPLKDLLSLAEEAVVQQVLTLADRLMQLYQLFCTICQWTLTMAVCAPSTKTYITSKLQATINFCGFTPVANQVLSLMSRDAVVAKRFFLPFQENRIVYADMKRHRNFFRCLLHSGGPVEVEKLYNVMEEEVVLSQFHDIATPSAVWQADASAFAAVEYVHHLSRLIQQAKTVIDGGWMTFSRLILAPERALLHSFQKFDAAESLALGKCLAFALNHLLSPKARAAMRYPPSFVTTLIDGIQLLLQCAGYEEIVFYFQQFFVPHFFFRIVQDDFTSVAEERSTLKQFAVVTDAVEGLFNQMELFSKIACSVHYRACFTLIVNEPQYAALACLAQYLGGDCATRGIGITLGFLANELQLSVEVTRHVVASLLACRDEEIMVRAKRLRKRGLISTSTGSAYPPFKTPDVRYSYFDTRNAVPTYRSLLSRRSSARPGKALSVRAWPQQLAWQPSPILSPLPFGTAATDDHDSPSSLAESKDPAASSRASIAAAPPVAASAASEPHVHDAVRSFIVASVSAVVHKSDRSVFSSAGPALGQQQRDTDGTTNPHTSVSHVWPLLTEATAVSLACVLKDTQHLLSATRALGAELHQTPLPSIDLLLQAMHEGLHATINTAPSYGAVTLILLCGLPPAVRSAVVRAFLSLVEVDDEDEATTAVVQRLLDPSGLTTVESLALVAQLAAVPLTVRVDRIGDVVDPQWKRSLCRWLRVDELHLRPAALSVVDDETAENKSSSESAAPPPAERLLSTRVDTAAAGGQATTTATTTTAPTAMATNGDDRPVSMSFEAFAAVVVEYAWAIPTPVYDAPPPPPSSQADGSGGNVSSPPPLRGAASSSDDTKRADRAEVAKAAKKPSKFLSEMGPAIDRMPQLAQHRPSTTSSQASLPARPGTSGRDTTEDPYSVDGTRQPPPSRGRLTSSRPPPPFAAATEDASTRRGRHVGPLRLSSPSQRSWIEDPIVRYSHMLGNE